MKTKKSYLDILPQTLKRVTFQSLFFGLTVLLANCSPKHNEIGESTHFPTIVAATGHVVSPDKLPLPRKAGTPTQVTIRHPEEIKTNTNVIVAGTPSQILAGTPKVCTPGNDNFSLPKVMPAIQRPFLIQKPEVVVAKDAYSKDVNPQNFSSYNKLQGLRHDQIRNIAQDTLGNIWFSSDEGLTRFDGRNFSHYTTAQGLNSNLTLFVFQDTKSNIWVGTFGGGVTRFDGSFMTNFTTAEGLPDNTVNCIYEDHDGNMWFGTGGGAVKFDGKNFIIYSTKEGLCHNDVRSFVQDRKGNLWIATSGGGFSIFDGKSFSNYTTRQGLPQDYIGVLFKDRQGSIWIGTSSAGVSIFDGKYFKNYTTKQGLSNDRIGTITQDSSGNMWFGTAAGGLSKFDGKHFTHYTENEGLSVNDIRSSLKDKNGHLWFGTRGGGVSRFDGSVFTHLTEKEGLSNNRIMSILQDTKGDFWFGSFGGYVTKFSTKEINGNEQNIYTYFSEKEGLIYSRIYSIIQDKSGNIWFGTDGGGISRFDGKTMTTYTFQQGLCNNQVRKMIQDREGNFWIATYGGGVSKFDGKNFTNYSIKEGLSSNKVICVFQDKDDNLWFGTDSGGAIKFDGKNFTHYAKAEGLSNSVYSIFQDKDGIIWFGTAGDGVVRFDGKNFTHYNQNDGLSNNYVMSILQDRKGNLWFGTRFGPNVIQTGRMEQVAKNPSLPLFKNFGYDNGFSGIGCNLGAIFEDQSGTIWIGSSDRLTAFHPDGEFTDTIPPNIQLTAVMLFNEEVPWSELSGKDTSIVLQNGIRIGDLTFDRMAPWYNVPENLKLPYTHNFITFNFIGISHEQTKKIRYRYQLVGLDNNWSISTERTEASYGNLPHGDYVFKVKAMNSEGYWSPEISYPFTIRPPWWSTWWFSLSLTLLILAFIFGIIKYRERKLETDKSILQDKVSEQTRELLAKNEALTQQKNEILEKNSAIKKKNEELQISNSEKDKFFSIIAHDVRGPLSSFLALTEIMDENLQYMTTSDLQAIITSMRSSSKNLYELLGNLLEWSQMERGMTYFNPEPVNLLELAKNCIKSVSELADKKSVSIALHIPANLMIFADKNMLATIIRNLMSNAVKFTRSGGETSITARDAENLGIEILVRDSGIGISEKMLDKLFELNGQTSRNGTDGEPSTGLGLVLCKEFVEKHNGKIWVESEVGKGSTFRFTLKMSPSGHSVTPNLG